jgi:hypothetical protein
MNRSWNCTAACSTQQVRWPGDLQAPMAHTDTSSCGPPSNLCIALAHFSIPTDRPQLRGRRTSAGHRACGARDPLPLEIGGVAGRDHSSALCSRHQTHCAETVCWQQHKRTSKGSGRSHRGWHQGKEGKKGGFHAAGPGPEASGDRNSTPRYLEHVNVQKSRP